VILAYAHPSDGRTCLGGDVVLIAPGTVALDVLAALDVVLTHRAGPHLLLAVLLSLREASATGRPWTPSDVIALTHPRAARSRGEHRQQLVNLVKAWVVILEAARWTIAIQTRRRSRAPAFLDAVPLVRHPRPGRGSDVKLAPELHRLLDRPSRRVEARMLQLDTIRDGPRQAARGGDGRVTGAGLFYARLAALRHVTLRAASSSRRSWDLTVRELLAQAGGIDLEAIEAGGRWGAWAAELLAELDAAGLLRHHSAALAQGQTVIIPQVPTSRPRPSNVVELAPARVARTATRRTRPRPMPRAVPALQASQGGR
jgi:hypothetical protein